MPRGDNPNSRKNLIVPTSEMARKNGAKGGRAKAEKQKEFASLTEAFRSTCSPERKAKIAESIVRMAEHGNLKATEMVINMLGETPKQEHTVEVKQSSKLADVMDQIGGQGLEE